MVKINEDKYKEMIRSCREWNTLMIENNAKHVPFLDSQTNVVQRPGNLYKTVDDRVEENNDNQSPIYIRYESIPYQRPKTNVAERILFGDIIKRRAEIEQGQLASQSRSIAGSSYIEQQLNTSLNEIPPDVEEKKAPSYNEFDDSDESNDIGGDDSDGDDYYETSRRKRKAPPSRPQSNRKRPARSGRPINYNENFEPTSCPIPTAMQASTPLPPSYQQPSPQYSTPQRMPPPTMQHTPSAPARQELQPQYQTPMMPRHQASVQQQQIQKSEDDGKPFICNICNAKYKSKPGLVYHHAHVHADPSTIPRRDSNASLTNDNSNLGSPSSVVASACAPNDYCDFCLGGEDDNRTTGTAEKLVACHDCGRAGHPTCLKHTPNMSYSIKKYGWQCIECKSCAICGTSDNDHVLLFCDDCDRGFHLYCLKPPLGAAPEGEWSCHLCQLQFGCKASKPAQKL